jgi:hypothetical protein
MVIKESLTTCNPSLYLELEICCLQIVDNTAARIHSRRKKNNYA